MAERRFKIGEFARRLKDTKRTASHYVQTGLIVPEQEPERPGMLNWFGEWNLYEFLVIKELQRNGFDLKTIKQIVQGDIFKMKVVGPGKEVMVIYDGHTDHGSVYFSATDEEGNYTVKMKGRKSSTVIDISELRAKAAELAS
jgi:DNA-binding transcriptional MerR regulator